jgi:formiminotetrahydrofolate cyclodeaminase
MGAALSSMICRLTIGKKKYKEVAEELKTVLEESEQLRDELKGLIAKDSAAFDKLVASRRMPKDTEAEIAARNGAILEATKGAARTPLETAGLALRVMELAKVVAEKGNVNSVSDAGVAALMAKAAIEGAIYNVKINIGGFEDTAFVEEMQSKAREVQEKSSSLDEEIRNIVESKL